MYNRKMFRLLGFFLAAVILLQTNISATYAAQGTNNVNQSIESNSKKEVPKSKALVIKKPNKIPAGIAKSEDKLEKWKDTKEIVESRTSNSKTYDNGDGTKTLVQFFRPIHVKDASGKYIDIENTLVPEKSKEGPVNYKNKIGLFNVLFSNSNKTPTIQVKNSNISIELTPEGAITQDVAVKNNQLLYQGSTSGINYLYTVSDTGLKEDIVLNHFVDTDTFTYELEVTGAEDVVEKNGEIQIVDKTGQSNMTLSAPVMADADGNQSKELSLHLDRKGFGSRYTVTLKVDKAWLKDPARVYPVKIDPTIRTRIYQEQKSGSDSIYLTGFSDTYVNEGSVKSNYSNSDVLRIGGFDGKKNRAYIKFPLPSYINADTNIISANLNMLKSGASGEGSEIQAFRVDNASFATQSVTWENQPDKDGSTRKVIGDPFSTQTIDSAVYYHWYITDAVRHWATNGGNNGIELVRVNGETGQGVEIYSSESSNDPCVEIIFNNGEPVDPEKPELVLERTNIYSNGTAYAKGEILWEEPAAEDDTGVIGSHYNKATIKYKLMPDGIEGEIIAEDFPKLEWKTEKFNLEKDKVYWIEADILVERVVMDLIEPDENGEMPENPPYSYETALEKKIETDKFTVTEVQPGDTLKRLAKHYMDDGTQYDKLKKLMILTQKH